MTTANTFAAGDRRAKALTMHSGARTLRTSSKPEDFEQSFSDLFVTASQRFGAVDQSADSGFYESVRASLGRLHDQFDRLDPNADSAPKS